MTITCQNTFLKFNYKLLKFKMKKIHLVLIVFFAEMLFHTASVATTWTFLAKTDAAEYLYDSSNLNESNSNIKLSIQINYYGISKNGIKSQLANYSIDCSERTYLLENSRVYTAQELRGIESIVDVGNQTREHVKENSMSELYFDTVCNKNNQIIKNISRDKTISKKTINSNADITSNSNIPDKKINFVTSQTFATNESNNKSWKRFTDIKAMENDETNTMEQYSGEERSYKKYRMISVLTNFDKLTNKGTRSEKTSYLVNCSTRHVSETFYSYDEVWERGSIKGQNHNNKIVSFDNYFSQYVKLFQNICKNHDAIEDQTLEDEWIKNVRLDNDRKNRLNKWSQYTCMGSTQSYRDQYLIEAEKSFKVDFAITVDHENLIIANFVRNGIFISNKDQSYGRNLVLESNSAIVASFYQSGGNLSWNIELNKVSKLAQVKYRHNNGKIIFSGKCEKGSWMSGDEQVKVSETLGLYRQP